MAEIKQVQTPIQTDVDIGAQKLAGDRQNLQSQLRPTTTLIDMSPSSILANTIDIPIEGPLKSAGFRLYVQESSAGRDLRLSTDNGEQKVTRTLVQGLEGSPRITSRFVAHSPDLSLDAFELDVNGRKFAVLKKHDSPGFVVKEIGEDKTNLSRLLYAPTTLQRELSLRTSDGTQKQFEFDIRTVPGQDTGLMTLTDKSNNNSAFGFIDLKTLSNNPRVSITEGFQTAFSGVHQLNIGDSEHLVFLTKGGTPSYIEKK